MVKTMTNASARRTPVAPIDSEVELPLDSSRSSGPTASAIAAYMPLVERIASRFMRRMPSSVQRDDVVAAGTLGLFHALRSSTHTCEEMFVAYARIRIQGAVLDELRKHDWSPRRRKTLESTGSGANESEPRSAAEPPPKSGVSVVRFDDLPAKSAASTIVDDTDSPLEDLIARRERAALHTALTSLPEREARVVRLRFFDGMPSKAIAEEMHVSEARVSQLSARATTRLRAILESAAFDGMSLAA